MAIKARSEKKPKFPPAIVRAWLDTVLNPIGDGLEGEESVLRDDNPTWRFREKRLVSLLLVKEHVQTIYFPNLEQFLSFHPALTSPVGEHDRRVQVLTGACGSLEDAILRSPLMRETSAALCALKETASLQPVFGAGDPGDYLKVLAEYLVNDVRRLPSFYSTSEFWNEHREKFVAIRESDDVLPYWQATRAGIANLLVSVVTFLTTLKAVRNNLSLATGVPIVERRAG